ncbi:MAG: alginate export family protein [Gemmataceae bacterium]
MDRRQSSRVRAWATASLLATLGVMGQAAQGQTPAPVPAGVQAPPVVRLPAVGPEAASTPVPLRAPDDGLGTVPSTSAPASALPAIGTLAPDPSAAPTPTPPAAAPCEGGGAGGEKPGGRYADVPPIQPLPRMGISPTLPTGPGYYRALDQWRGTPTEGPPKYPYPRFSLKPFSFFDVDWRYLDDPNNTETDYWDFIKRQRFGPDDLFMWTGGGELRARYNFIENGRSGTGPEAGASNSFDLFRARLYSDLYITENFRIFAEFLSATSPDSLLPPLPIDYDPYEWLNLFIDARVATIADQPVWARIGRQELLYGSQRLISPLEWANYRRTFQGARVFWDDQKNSIDAFFVQPVLPNSASFNSVDNNVVFTGLWYTRTLAPSNYVDLYYLFLDDTNNLYTGTGGVKGGKSVSTFGSRWFGTKDNWLWDVEGMVQAGEHVNQGLFAKAFTMAGGYYFKEWQWTPTLWVSYDYASGTPNPGQGTLNQTFSQLFPFGHYYFGFIDVVGRRNINDVSTCLTFYPENWIFTQLQCHNFWLDSAKDALYAASGLPIRQDKTGRAGNYVGTELDFLINFHLTNHSDIFMSYSYMFAGPFWRATGDSPAARRDPQAYYVQYSYRF